MKRTYFHGTSADNLDSILENGLIIDSEKLWEPSEEGIYFWSPDLFVEMGETEEEYKNDYVFERVNDSAQCALALAKDCRAVIIEAELDDSEVFADKSCPNMEGAVVCYRNIKKEEIKSIKITNDLSLLKGYFISLMAGHNLFIQNFSVLEKKIGKVFKDSTIYLEDINSLMDWENVELTK